MSSNDPILPPEAMGAIAQAVQETLRFLVTVNGGTPGDGVEVLKMAFIASHATTDHFNNVSQEDAKARALKAVGDFYDTIWARVVQADKELAAEEAIGTPAGHA